MASVRICLAKGFSFDQISGGLCQGTPPPNPLPASEEGGQELSGESEEGGQELSGESGEGGQELREESGEGGQELREEGGQELGLGM
ncbi:MAG: hypothetical protein ACK5RY_11370 [Dolichospermum sp.]|nr:hypothetical protein [Anabaena sp. 49628_E55]